MIEKIQLRDFEQVFNIMRQSFTEDEFRPFIEQKDLLNNPLYNIFVLKSQKCGRIKAFICVWNFPDFSYIEHFAVAAEHRNSGLGSKMLSELSDLLNQRFCLEVELPETDLSKRRIEFYKRAGFFENPYSYIQPPISSGKNEVPLMLMSTVSQLTNEEFSQVRNTLYKEVYKLK